MSKSPMIFILKDILPYNNINNHMPDYNNGKIYTIRCRDDTSLIYVGSTTQKLSQRWNDHKQNARNPIMKEYHFKIYEQMRQYGLDNFYIELYEMCPCESKEQLFKREGEITRLIGTLNSRIAGRTPQEYHVDNKDHKSEYHKKWYLENKEHVKMKVKQHHEENRDNYEYRKNKVVCECGMTISYTHKSRHYTSKKHNNLMSTKSSETTN